MNNHKKYLRAKLREMGNFTMSLNQGNSNNITNTEGNINSNNIKSEGEVYLGNNINTLYNFSPENTLFSHKSKENSLSPKCEEKYMDNRVSIL